MALLDERMTGQSLLDPFDDLDQLGMTLGQPADPVQLPDPYTAPAAEAQAYQALINPPPPPLAELKAAQAAQAAAWDRVGQPTQLTEALQTNLLDATQDVGGVARLYEENPVPTGGLEALQAISARVEEEFPERAAELKAAGARAAAQGTIPEPVMQGLTASMEVPTNLDELGRTLNAAQIAGEEESPSELTEVGGFFEVMGDVLKAPFGAFKGLETALGDVLGTRSAGNRAKARARADVFNALQGPEGQVDIPEYDTGSAILDGLRDFNRSDFEELTAQNTEMLTLRERQKRNLEIRQSGLTGRESAQRTIASIEREAAARRAERERLLEGRDTARLNLATGQDALASTGFARNRQELLDAAPFKREERTARRALGDAKSSWDLEAKVAAINAGISLGAKTDAVYDDERAAEKTLFGNLPLDPDSPGNRAKRQRDAYAAGDTTEYTQLTPVEQARVDAAKARETLDNTSQDALQAQIDEVRLKTGQTSLKVLEAEEAERVFNAANFPYGRVTNKERSAIEMKAAIEAAKAAAPAAQVLETESRQRLETAPGYDGGLTHFERREKLSKILEPFLNNRNRGSTHNQAAWDAAEAQILAEAGMVTNAKFKDPWYDPFEASSVPTYDTFEFLEPNVPAEAGAVAPAPTADALGSLLSGLTSEQQGLAVTPTGLKELREANVVTENQYRAIIAIMRAAPK